MEMRLNELYRTRKRFFNDRAEWWHDMWDKDPNAERRDRHAKAFERLFSLLPLKREDRVLDAGCGTGVLIPFILECITDAGILYELDFADKMIATNRSRHERNNIRFIVSEAEKAPLDEASCDAVICFSSFPHFQDKAEAVRSLARILKPGGVFAVAHFDSSEEINKHHESHDAVRHDRLPDEAAMRALLGAAGLGIDRFIDEPGFYCVVARKQCSTSRFQSRED